MAAIVRFSTNHVGCLVLSFKTDHRDGTRPLKPDVMRRYEETDVPKHAIFQDRTKTIPDFVPISVKLSMCREARELIESFEPAVHQFFPIEISRRTQTPIYRLDGRILDEPYFVFNVQTMLDAVGSSDHRCKSARLARIVPLYCRVSRQLQHRAEKGGD
jgi:hypothetical protein